jgi:hypothetical protein
MEEMMYRKMLLVLAAIMGVALASTDASAARGFRGGFRGGGFRGGRGFGFAAPAIGLGLGLGLGAGLYGGYPYAYGGYPYYAYGGCWRRIVVHTPFGPRLRRIWVC